MGKLNLTVDRLKECLEYDPVTGIFVWKTRKRSEFKTDRSWNSFNKKHAGKRAGNKVKPADSQCIYEAIGIDGVGHRSHRIAWLYAYGEWPKDQIDHIDGNGMNNAISNLRSVNGGINQKNRPMHHSNKMGIIGVRKRNKKWNVRISNNGLLEELGTYEDFFDACCVRKSAERRYGYHENHGRPFANLKLG